MVDRKMVDSMQNNVQRKNPILAFAPLAIHEKIAREAGYTNIEYYPFQGASFQIRFMEKLDTSEISAFHESWGNGKFPFVFIMREKLASLNDSLILQSRSNKDLLNIVYPHEESKGEIWPKEFDQLQNKIIQPTIDLMKEWGVDNLTDFLAKANYFGFTSFALQVTVNSYFS